jgi:L-fuconolactonase
VSAAPGDALPAQRVDAHTHVWELTRRPQPWIDPQTMAVLHSDHTLTDLRSELQGADVHGAVLVQVLNDSDETDDYLWLGTEPMIRGVVGWADLLSSEVETRLDALSNHPSGSRLVGIRHQALAEPDPAGWLQRVAEGRALAALARRGLTFDLMFRPEHLSVVHDVTRRHAATTFVLNHAGKVPVATGWRSAESERWAAAITELATSDNLVCKLSGLTTMAHLDRWTVADLRPFVDHLLDRFGPDRLMFGSDWPVSLRAGTYQITVDAVGELLAALTAPERAAVLGGTAVRTYTLS